MGVWLALVVAASAADSPGTAPAQPTVGGRFRIRYLHAVRNKTESPLRDVRIYLPIPASDGYQTVAQFSVWRDGQPAKFGRRRDRFGQEIARLVIDELAPGKEVEVGFDVDVALRQPPRVDLARAKLGKLEDIPPDIRDRFTPDLPGYYDLLAPNVKSLAERVTAGRGTLLGKLRAIHDYVADKQNFRYERRDGWDGAARVLERKAGSCSELTFVFCALCRAVGIPTRLVGATLAGDRFPHTDTVWHRWAEVYLPGPGWVSVDVTLDRGRPAKDAFFGSHRGRVLVVTRTDGGAILGKSYLGANSHNNETTRRRKFLWSRLP